MSYIPLMDLVRQIGERIKWGNYEHQGYYAGWFEKTHHYCRRPPIVPRPDPCDTEEGNALDRILGSTAKMIDSMRNRGASEEEIQNRLRANLVPEILEDYCIVCGTRHITSRYCKTKRRSDSIRSNGRDETRRRGRYGDRLAEGFAHQESE